MEEPILRRMRIKKVLPTILKYADCRVLDIGCGWENRPLKTMDPFIKNGVGIDFKVQEMESAKLKAIKMVMGSAPPFMPQTFDVVTMLAVLEHLSEPLGSGTYLDKGRTACYYRTKQNIAATP